MNSKVKASVYTMKEDNLHPVMKAQNDQLNKKTVSKSESGESKTMSEFLIGDVIEPPYDFSALKLLCEQSSILQQCIDAYKINITGFGLESVTKEDLSSLNDEKKNAVEKERSKLKDYLNFINLETPIEEVIELVIDDLEKTGNAYIEILRSDDGEISTFEYLPSENMRLCKKDEKSSEVTREIEIDGKIKKKTTRRKFRRFVQVVNLDKVYFKEYGHPDDLHYKTGEYGDLSDHRDKASEVLHFKIGNGTYGKPRWIGNVVSVVGARKAEELNYLYFKNGRHLPAAITVSNGMLDEDSKAALENYMNGAQGVENAHKFLLLEAMGDSTENAHGEEEKTNAKIEIKDLAQIIQKDALFMDYDNDTRKKIRSSFRLPPLYTGESQEYNRATSDTARQITEEQVFQPERIKIARRLNAVLLPELEIKSAKLAFKDADFRDPVEIAKVLAPFINAGAVGPNDLRDLLGEVLGTKLNQWEEEYNRPLAISRMGDPFLANYINGDGTLIEGVQKSDNEIVHILKDLRDHLERQDDAEGR